MQRKNMDIKLLNEKCALFAGMTEKQISLFCKSCAGYCSCYSKGTIVLHQGDTCGDIIIVIKGNCRGVVYGFDGNRSILALFGAGDIFGDVLAMNPGRTSPVTVETVSECELFHIPFCCLTGDRGGKYERAVLRNLTGLISDKYFELLFRNNCLSKKTIREKLLYYLQSFDKKHTGEPFNIPFDRLGLAEFLGVERSALSRVLSALKEEKLIDFYKNTFKLLT